MRKTDKRRELKKIKRSKVKMKKGIIEDGIQKEREDSLRSLRSDKRAWMEGNVIEAEDGAQQGIVKGVHSYETVTNVCTEY